jgi:hypothetical protein
MENIKTCNNCCVIVYLLNDFSNNKEFRMEWELKQLFPCRFYIYDRLLYYDNLDISLWKKEVLTMGEWGWFHWLSQDVDKLKVIRSMTKDAEQLILLDEVIAHIESKITKE